MRSDICCRDKNYGGLLIICDRIFGRFASEKNNEEIIYGLVVISPSFNLLQLQLQTFFASFVFKELAK
ncbi:hypothetical protein WA026_012475 [Henosepilachna vigintioctopunctata]|uniref:Uncharacterized protein n=1 Tax=Henosepilachna vigintioctopunctata TaxID=420089 RepID=A0AAW1V0J5_9CUCU